MGIWLFNLISFLLPIIFFPLFRDAFTLPKWTVGMLMVPVFFFTMNQLRKKTTGCALFPFLALILVHFVSIFHSINPYYGFLTVGALIIALFWYFSGYLFLQETPQKIRFGMALSLSGVIVSIVGLLQQYGIRVFGDSQVLDPSSLLGHRNYAAQFLIILLPISVFLIRSGANIRQKLLGILSLVLGSMHLIVTGCRGAWIGLFISLLAAGLIYFLLKWPQTAFSKRKMAAVAALFVAVFLILLALPSFRSRFASVSDIHKGTNHFRILVWQSTLKMIAGFPLNGVSAGNFMLEYPLYRIPEEQALSGEDIFVHVAHNDLLHVAAETGFFGLLAMAWLGITFLNLVRTRISSGRFQLFHLVGAIALMATWFQSMVSMNFRNPVPLLLSALLLGSLDLPMDLKRKMPRIFFPRIIGIAITVILIILWGPLILHAYYLGTGTKFEQLQLYSQASHQYSQSHRLIPYEYQAAYHGGYCYLQTGELQNALASTDQALKSNPHFRNAVYNRAVILDEMNRADDALEWYQKVLSLDPVYTDAWNNLGVLYDKMNRLTDAVYALEQAVKNNPWEPDPLSNLGNAYFRLGRAEDAKKKFEQGLLLSRSLILDRSTTRHFSLLGKIMFRAAPLFKGSHGPFSPWGTITFPPRPETPPLIENPSSGVKITYLKDSQFLQVECSDEIGALGYLLQYQIRNYQGQTSIYANLPIHADLWNNLGVVVESLGDFKSAEAAYNRALMINPQHFHAKSNLQRIKLQLQ